MIGKIYYYLKNIFAKYHLDYFFVFAVFIFFFSWMQATFSLADPDSFYHAKISQYLGQGILLQQFPWLQGTNLVSQFVDHHLLYHLVLVPFVKIFDPIVGVKLAMIILDSIFLTLVYWLFKKYKFYWPFILTILIPLSPWLFRANLVKAVPGFLILLALAFYFLDTKKYFFLFLSAFASVWFYAGWPILWGMVFIYSGTIILLDILKKSKEKIFKKNKYLWKPIVATSLGIVGGIVINPFFPGNLYFYWLQIVQISLVNYHKIISVGAEWYPNTIYSMVSSYPFICTLLLAGILIFILNYKKQSARSLTWGIMAVIFFILTLKAKRNVEFFIPAVIIFFSFALSEYLRKFPKEELKRIFSLKPLAIAPVFVFISLFSFLCLTPSNIVRTKTQLLNGLSIDYYKEVSLWLKDNTPAGSVVLNSNWSNFPLLFYYNDHNYYLSGLDPTFMYIKDPDKYRTYAEILTGQLTDGLAERMIVDFNASYALIDARFSKAIKLFEEDASFEKVYSDDQAAVFKIIDSL